MTKRTYKRLDNPRSAVIVSHNRSGGTYLCHSLNSHPVIHCFPDEVIHSNNRFMRVIKDPVKVLDIALHLQQFEVCVAKISYTQFLDYPKVRQYLESIRVKVIHLTRGNWVASAISEMVRHKQNHPTHAFYERPKVGAVNLDPDRLWDIIWHQKGGARKVRTYLTRMGAEVLELTYPEIVGGEGVEAEEVPSLIAQKICDYLGVPPERLCPGYMRKVTNNYAMVNNWQDIQNKLNGTKFQGMMLEVENAYRKD